MVGGDKLFEYTPPFMAIRVMAWNTCKMCNEQGSSVKFVEGQTAWADSQAWICCDKCYREERRLGRVW